MSLARLQKYVEKTAKKIRTHPKSQCLLALDELVAVHGSLVKFQLRIRIFKAIEAKASTVSTFNCFQTTSWDIMGVISSSFFLEKQNIFGHWSSVADLHFHLFLSERDLVRSTEMIKKANLIFCFWRFVVIQPQVPSVTQDLLLVFRQLVWGQF